MDANQLLDFIFEINTNLPYIEAAHQNGAMNLVIGNTGAGKSTLVNFLLGNQLIASINPLTGQYILDLAERTEGPRIGDNLVSQTLLPNIAQDQDGTNTYLDCPGFKDNRSIKKEIGNAYYIHNTANELIGRVLLVVLHSDMIQPRLLSLTELAESVSHMFVDLNALQNSMSLIITQSYNPMYNNNIALDMLNAVTNNVSINMSNGARQVLGYLRQNIVVTKTPIQEGIYPESQVALKATIAQVPVAALVTKPVISPAAKIAAVRLVDSIKQHIENQFEQAENQQKEHVDAGYFVRLIVEQQKELNQQVGYRKTSEDYKKISKFLKALDVPNVGAIDQEYLQAQKRLMQSYDDEIKKLITTKHSQLIGVIKESDKPKEMLNFLVNVKLESKMSKMLECFKEFDGLFGGSSCQEDINALLQQVNSDQFQDSQFSLKNELQSTLNTVLLNTMSLPIARELGTKIVSNENDSGITYAGTTIKISDIKKWHAKHTSIYAYKDFHLDQDIKLDGPASLSIISPIWYLKRNIQIDLSGKNGLSHSEPAASGNHGGSGPGGPGANGQDGGQGKDGGSFYGMSHGDVDRTGMATLIINASGGKGGSGQNGGNGGPGGSSVSYSSNPYTYTDTERVTRNNLAGLKTSQKNSYTKTKNKRCNYFYKDVTVSKTGYNESSHTTYYPVGKGGDGGKAGLGGKPGVVNLFNINEFDNNGKDLLKSSGFMETILNVGEKGVPGFAGNGATAGKHGGYLSESTDKSSLEHKNYNDEISNFLKSLTQISGNQGYEKFYQKGLLSQFSQMTMAEQMTQDEVKEQLKQAIDQQNWALQNALSYENVLEFHDNALEANNSPEIIDNIRNKDGNLSYNIILGHEHIVAVAKVNNLVYVIDGIEGNHALTARLSEILGNSGAEVRVVNTSFQTDFHLVNQCGHIAVRSLIAAVDYIRNNHNFSTEELQQHIRTNLKENLIEKKTFKGGADVDPGLNYEDDSDDDDDPAVEADNILQLENSSIREDLSNQHYYSHDSRHDLLSYNDGVLQSTDLRDDAAAILCPSMVSHVLLHPKILL